MNPQSDYATQNARLQKLQVEALLIEQAKEAQKNKRTVTSSKRLIAIYMHVLTLTSG